MLAIKREAGEPKIGINLPGVADEPSGQIPDLAGAARHAEQVGFESVWVPDLVVGDGTPAVDNTTSLASVVPVTERVRLGFGVLVAALRPLPWLALQIATLQHLSKDRILLGVGAGGFPTAPFWQAVGVAREDRAHRTDTALQTLPQLVTGEPAQVGSPAVSLTFGPAAAMPPVLVGGTSPAARRRAVAYGNAWFPSLLSADELGTAVRHLGELADQRGRTCPSVTVGVHYLPSAQARSAFVQSLIDHHGRRPDEANKIALSGTPEQVAAGMHDYLCAGADRVVLAPTGPGWTRQADILTQARALLE